MNEQRTNQDNLLDALMVAQAKLIKIAALCNEETVWNYEGANAEVRFFANDIREVLYGTVER